MGTEMYSGARPPGDVRHDGALSAGCAANPAADGDDGDPDSDLGLGMATLAPAARRG